MCWMFFGNYVPLTLILIFLSSLLHLIAFFTSTLGYPCTCKVLFVWFMEYFFFLSVICVGLKMERFVVPQLFVCNVELHFFYACKKMLIRRSMRYAKYVRICKFVEMYLKSMIFFLRNKNRRNPSEKEMKITNNRYWCGKKYTDIFCGVCKKKKK